MKSILKMEKSTVRANADLKFFYPTKVLVTALNSFFLVPNDHAGYEYMDDKTIRGCLSHRRSSR